MNGDMHFDEYQVFKHPRPAILDLSETKRDEAVASMNVIVIKKMIAFEAVNYKKAKYLIIDESTHCQLKTEMAKQMLGVAEGHRVSDITNFSGMIVVLIRAKTPTIEFGW